MSLGDKVLFLCYHLLLMDKHGKLFDRIAYFYQFRTPMVIRTYRNNLKNHGIWSKLPEKGKKVLDIGAGTGAFGYVFKEFGYEVTVTDVAPKMIKMCKRNGLDGIVCDLPEDGLPFSENSFDLVIAAHFIHGLSSEKRVKVFKECKRVSRGKVLFYEYNVLKKNRLKARFLEFLEGGYYHEFRANGLEQLRLNFSNVEMYELNRNSALYLCSETEKLGNL